MSATLTALQRTTEQRMAALARANEVRVRRAQFKRECKAGRISLLDVLADPPSYVANMKLLDLLLTTPKIGEVKAKQVLAQARVSPVKTIAGVSPRQRSEVAQLVERWR